MNAVAIIGFGLIGASLARALKARGLAGELRAVDPDPAQLKAGRALGFLDRPCASVAEAVTGAELVVVAVPVAASREVFAQIRAAGPLEAVLTDVGSTKGSVIEDARAAFGALPANFVPGHPIAGTERSGAAHADAALFAGRRVILTPHAGTDPAVLAAVEAMWRGVGAEVVRMDADRHDRVLAATSHLPHMLAYALVDHLAAEDAREEMFRFAAGGFRDFTRIASSSPRMWRDIAMANRQALLDALDGFSARLAALRDAVAAGDGDAVMDCFERARAARERFLELIEGARQQ